MLFGLGTGSFSTAAGRLEIVIFATQHSKNSARAEDAVIEMRASRAATDKDSHSKFKSRRRYDMKKHSTWRFILVAATFLVSVAFPGAASAQKVSFVARRDFTAGYDPIFVA